MKLSASEIIFKVLAYAIVSIFALLSLYPLVYAFSASISGKMAYELGKIVLWPKDVNFIVYKEIIYDKQFWISYTNTLFYTIFGTLWSMLISVTGAYALSKKKLVGQRVFNFLLVFTMWFSAGMIPLFLNYKSMGVDNRWGIIVAFGVQAYNIILLRNYFSGVPKEIEEAAIVDGANEFQILTKIYLPMSKAALATVTLFYATTRWNGYYWASMLLKGAQHQPLQVYLRQLHENYQKQIEYGTDLKIPFAADSLIYAIIICSIIPILIIYPYIQKYFVKGVNLGGVKE